MGNPRHVRDRRRLIAYLAREFGVTVIERNAETAWQWQHRPAEWSEAPFTSGLGVVWDEFKIIATTERPDAAKEFTFLGWEMAVVEHLGLSMKEFHRSNGEYGICWRDHNCMDTIKLGSKDWWKFVGEAQATSREAKLFHKDGMVPTALRSNVLR